jgi:hypothetical protein
LTRPRSDRDALAEIMARVRVTEPVLDGSFAERLKADRNRRLIEGDPEERDAIERANKARRGGEGGGRGETAFSAEEGFELCERAIDAIYDRNTHPWVTHREVVDWLMQDPAARGDIDRWTAHKGGGMTPFRMAAAAQGLFCKSWSVPATSDPPSRYEARADGEAYRPRRR